MKFAKENLSIRIKRKETSWWVIMTVVLNILLEKMRSFPTSYCWRINILLLIGQQILPNFPNCKHCGRQQANQVKAKQYCLRQWSINCERLLFLGSLRWQWVLCRSNHYKIDIYIRSPVVFREFSWKWRQTSLGCLVAILCYLLMPPTSEMWVLRAFQLVFRYCNYAIFSSI